MKLCELMESFLDWRVHSKKRYSHDDLLAPIEDEIKHDVMKSEKAKLNRQRRKSKKPPR